MIVRPSVVFPQPDSPTTPSVSPGANAEVDAVDRAHLSDGVAEEARLDREVLDEAVDAEEVASVRRAIARRFEAVDRLGGAHRRPRCQQRPAIERTELFGEVARGAVVGAASSVARSAGTSVRQTSRPCECTQRGWNAHPGGGLMRLGGWPGIGSSRSWSMSTRARLFMSPIVYGWRGESKIVKTSPISTTRPAYMTTTRSASSAMSPRSCVMRMIAACVCSCAALMHLDDLRLDGDVERGRRLVGDEHARVVGHRHRDHRALAHPARELVRVLIDAPLGERDADALEQLDRALPRCARPSCPGLCVRTASEIWSPIVKTGFSDVIGSWKIIAISPPRRSRSSFFGIFSRSWPL